MRFEDIADLVNHWNDREFYWSPDGKTLGILLYRTDSDVVIMRDSGSSQKAMSWPRSRSRYSFRDHLTVIFAAPDG
jgi:hypothetical protein